MNTAHDLARAALSALAEALAKEGLPSSSRDLEHLMQQALRERSGTIRVTITTPTGSSGELAAKVRTLMKEKAGKEAEIIEQKDPTIIGGAVISYGDERIDLSVKRSLVDAEILLTPNS